MLEIDIIDLLQTIADPVTGTNFKYRYDNNLLVENIETFSYAFDDRRMAYFYYNTLKNVDNIECTIEERKIQEYRTLAKIVEVMNDENELENKIQYYQVPYREVWRWHFVFKSSIKQIVDQQLRIVN